MKLNIKNEIDYFRKRIARDVTTFGTWTVTAVAFVLLFAFGESAFAVRFLVVTFCGIALETVVKMVHKRNRPDFKKVKLVSVYQSFEEHSSFPSGHSTKAAVLATMLHLKFMNPYVTVLSVMLALFVAWSRVELERHYVKDVVAGLILGAVVGYIGYSF